MPWAGVEHFCIPPVPPRDLWGSAWHDAAPLPSPSQGANANCPSFDCSLQEAPAPSESSTPGLSLHDSMGQPGATQTDLCGHGGSR